MMLAHGETHIHINYDHYPHIYLVCKNNINFEGEYIPIPWKLDELNGACFSDLLESIYQSYETCSDWPCGIYYDRDINKSKGKYLISLGNIAFVTKEKICLVKDLFIIIENESGKIIDYSSFKNLSNIDRKEFELKKLVVDKDNDYWSEIIKKRSMDLEREKEKDLYLLYLHDGLSWTHLDRREINGKIYWRAFPHKEKNLWFKVTRKIKKFYD